MASDSNTQKPWHIPVLLNETISALNINPSGIYVDGTIGGAGHSAAILSALGEEGLLVGIDRDAAAIAASTKRLKSLLNPRASFVGDAPLGVPRHTTKPRDAEGGVPYETSPQRPQGIAASYALVRERHENIPAVLEELGIKQVDGVLLDLGVSSHQLDNPKRGFSYRFDAPLDMRMDDRQSLTAFNIVNGYQEKSLVKILYEYGEERYAKRIARAILAARPIKTTLELAQVVEAAVPKAPPSAGHPAMRTFQAVRIAVNGELTALAKALEEAVTLLKPGGRVCVISFHSLEDRIVKQTFKNLADPCKCPRTLPYCVCGKQSVLKLITKKPVRPGEEELAQNSRAHSAKLRAAERV